MSWVQEYKIYWLVALAALSSWWLTQRQYQPPQSVTIAESNLDLISLDYSKITTDQDGLPKNELHAAEMRHSHKDGSNQFVRPVMKLLNSEQAPWIIRSETAVLEKDGDTLHMQGKSVINRDANGKNKALTLVSADLLVKLSKHYAGSEAFTELLSAPHKTTGQGVELTFTSPIHLKLLSTVKGYYELKKNHTH